MNLVDVKVKHNNMDEAWHVIWNNIRGTVRDKITDKVWYSINDVVSAEVKSNIKIALDGIQ